MNFLGGLKSKPDINFGAHWQIKAAEWEASKEYPYAGKVVSRLIGVALVPFVKIGDVVLNVIFGVGKLVAGVFSDPYKSLVYRIGEMDPDDRSAIMQRIISWCETPLHIDIRTNYFSESLNQLSRVPHHLASVITSPIINLKDPRNHDDYLIHSLTEKFKTYQSRHDAQSSDSGLQQLREIRLAKISGSPGSVSSSTRSRRGANAGSGEHADDGGSSGNLSLDQPNQSPQSARRAPPPLPSSPPPLPSSGNAATIQSANSTIPKKAFVTKVCDAARQTVLKSDLASQLSFARRIVKDPIKLDDVVPLKDIPVDKIAEMHEFLKQLFRDANINEGLGLTHQNGSLDEDALEAFSFNFVVPHHDYCRKRSQWDTLSDDQKFIFREFTLEDLSSSADKSKDKSSNDLGSILLGAMKDRRAESADSDSDAEVEEDSWGDEEEAETTSSKTTAESEATSSSGKSNFDKLQDFLSELPAILEDLLLDYKKIKMNNESVSGQSKRKDPKEKEKEIHAKSLKMLQVLRTLAFLRKFEQKVLQEEAPPASVALSPASQATASREPLSAPLSPPASSALDCTVGVESSEALREVPLSSAVRAQGGGGALRTGPSIRPPRPVSLSLDPDQVEAELLLIQERVDARTVARNRNNPLSAAAAASALKQGHSRAQGGGGGGQETPAAGRGRGGRKGKGRRR